MFSSIYIKTEPTIGRFSEFLKVAMVYYAFSAKVNSFFSSFSVITLSYFYECRASFGYICSWRGENLNLLKITFTPILFFNASQCNSLSLPRFVTHCLLRGNAEPSLYLKHVFPVSYNSIGYNNKNTKGRNLNHNQSFSSESELIT